MPAFTLKTALELTIDDELSFRHVGLYAELKSVLCKACYTFRVLPPPQAGRWDHALALNLTFWGSDEGGDILVDDHIPADVIAHVAWHHLANRALSSAQPSSADALFLGESIASAFDVYLVGRLLGHAPESSFLATQIPAMADAAAETGLSDAQFEALLEQIADDPERSFENLRELLYDVTRELYACRGADEALGVLTLHDAHPMAALLHRHEVSNWVLYARAYASKVAKDDRAAAVDRALREAPDALEWLAREWIR